MLETFGYTPETLSNLEIYCVSNKTGILIVSVITPQKKFWPAGRPAGRTNGLTNGRTEVRTNGQKFESLMQAGTCWVQQI